MPAVAVAVAAFALYHATLLPGFDFGDTGSFQATVGSPIITPRNAYPLYFALGNIILWTTGADPAHAMNLVSAVQAAIACGLFVVVAGALSGSTAAAVAAALLFAVSYTFWSQSVIAEVYALHMVFVLLTLWLLLRWADRPTFERLALFFAVYALGFGNHLSMILLAPGYTMFLLLAAPRGWRSLLAPRVVALAVGCACAGALQYAWNLSALWLLPNPPRTVADALLTFWFDVTKSDWRDTMVMNVPQSLLGDHAAMYWFDLKQQFGLAGPVLAVAGLAQLALSDWRRATLVAMLFAVNAGFAFSYNVGDTHVFYLPSHLIVALLAAPAIALAAPAGVRRRAVLAGAASSRSTPAPGPTAISPRPRSQSRPSARGGHRVAHRRPRRSARGSPGGSELAGAKRSLVFRQGDPPRGGARADAGRAAVRAGLRRGQSRDRARGRPDRPRARDAIAAAYGRCCRSAATRVVVPTLADHSPRVARARATCSACCGRRAT